METCGSAIKENKTFKEHKEKDKKNERDYIPEDIIIGERRLIPFKEVNRIQKKLDTICKILRENDDENGTGFFCKINIKGKEMKALFTNNHVLNEKNIIKNSIIKFMYNNIINTIKITENRFTYTNEELDYTCIQIFDNEPYNNYLTIDNDINNNNAYEEYKNDNFVIIQFIGNEDSPYFDSGEILKINNNNQMYYNISTQPGASGSPVLNSNRNLSVIGIHCGKVNKGEFKDKCNRGTYFQPILNDIQNNFHKEDFKNEIIGIYDIKKNVNKDINLLNYFESNDDKYKQYNNKKDFENSIEIFLENQKINFQFKYQFKNEKKYMLRFKIKKPLENLRNMFYDCSSLTSLNLSNFNTNNVKAMNGMFYKCSSLTSLNLSNFNTKKVTEMEDMFENCSSLTSLDLCNFNTRKVILMENIFDNCSSLTSLDLSNFKNNNVTDMNMMFLGLNQNCKIICNDEKIKKIVFK